MSTVKLPDIDQFLTCFCKLIISSKNLCLWDAAVILLVKDYILEKFSAASSPGISGPILFGAIPHYPASKYIHTESSDYLFLILQQLLYCLRIIINNKFILFIEL